MGFLLKLSRRFREEKQETMSSGLPSHDELVESAKQEWQAAQSLFDNVSEADLIDHAIYKLIATERRYIFLLQETRRLRSNESEQFKKGGSPDREI